MSTLLGRLPAHSLCVRALIETPAAGAIGWSLTHYCGPLGGSCREKVSSCVCGQLGIRGGDATHSKLTDGSVLSTMAMVCADSGANSLPTALGGTVPAVLVGDTYYAHVSPCSGGCSQISDLSGWSYCTVDQWSQLPTPQELQNAGCAAACFGH